MIGRLLGRPWLSVVGLVLAGVSAPAAMAAPSVDDLLRRAQTDIFTMSPTGQYIAATSRVDDRMMMAIVDRATLKPVRIFDPDERGAVNAVEWSSAERLLLTTSVRDEILEQEFFRPFVVAINADGTRKRAIRFSIIDTLADDDDHVLVADCGQETLKGCIPYARLTEVDGSGVGPKIVDAPAPNASLMSDSRGTVRLAWAWDDADNARLWRLNGKAWEPVNDEATSGIESVPIGVSRDGRHAFLRSEQRSGPDVLERLDLQTGKRDVLLSDPLLDPAYIVWSVDGIEPIGAAYGLGVPRARFWDPDHPDARLLRKLEAAFPEDAVRFGSGSRDGAHAVVHVSSDRDPGSYYLLKREGLRLDLAARMRPWLDVDELARSTPIEFQARDGTKLHGYLTLPLRAPAPPPLVVMPHGGPFGVRDSWGFDEEVQILASRGYAVLRVNFRGSAGFGRAFMEAGYRQWGRRMQEDVIDATRWAQASGKVDAGRACIWGASYGGYVSLMAAVQTPEQYRCVIASAALSDLNLQWKWGDTHRSRYGRNFLDRAMGSDPKELFAYSPVNHVANIRSPLMVVHGVFDERVSFAHVRALRAALDRAGIPYEGYFPTDELHGIQGDKNRREYYGRVLAFLDRHIGSPR
jgi:dienelactone hydrolase